MVGELLVVVDIFLDTCVWCYVVGIHRKNSFVAETSPVFFAERDVHLSDYGWVLKYQCKVFKQ